MKTVFADGVKAQLVKVEKERDALMKAKAEPPPKPKPKPKTPSQEADALSGGAIKQIKRWWLADMPINEIAAMAVVSPDAIKIVLKISDLRRASA